MLSPTLTRMRNGCVGWNTSRYLASSPLTFDSKTDLSRVSRNDRSKQLAAHQNRIVVSDLLGERLQSHGRVIPCTGRDLVQVATGLQGLNDVMTTGNRDTQQVSNIR